MAAAPARQRLDGPRPVPAWALALIGAALLLIAYSPVRDAQFLWDDDAHVTANPAMHGIAGLEQIWTSGKANYCPLTMTTFWLLHAGWGLAPGPYHLVNVMFHVGGAFLLWRVLARLRVPGAWLGALLWAVHPVQVESAAWVSELKNTQSGFFYLAAIGFFVRWLQHDAGPRLRRDYWFALVLAVLAILSKTSTVMLPVVLGLLGWWLGHRRWRDLLWLAPFFAVSLLASGWTIWEQKVNSMASGPEWAHGLGARLMIAGKVPWFYLGKLLWPDPLIFIYPRWDVTATGLVHWIPLAGTIALGVLLWRHREGAGQPAFLGLGYFFVSLFPVLGLFDVFFFRYSFVGDHFQYLASMGPLVLAGAALDVLARRLTRPVAFAGAGLLLLAPAWLTWKQCHIYRTNHLLWEDTVRLNPDAWIARVNLGSELIAAGRAAEALVHYEAALRLRPQFVEVETNVGNALLMLGRASEAIPHYQAALRGKWGVEQAHDSLGLALTHAGRAAEAVQHFETSLRLRPGYPSTQFNFAQCLLQLGRVEDARKQLEAAVQGEPRSTAYRNALARALLLGGRRDEAVQQCRTVLAQNPGDFEAQCTLGTVLVQLGQYADAVALATAASRARPADDEPYYILGNALLLSGRPVEAIPAYETVLRLKPDRLVARGNLGTALYRIGRYSDAVAQYAEVVRAKPSADAHQNLAGALLQLGQLEPALRHFAQAVELAPNEPQVRSNYALALARAGRLEDAAAQCEAALRLQPGHAAAQALLAQVRRDLAARGAAPP